MRQIDTNDTRTTDTKPAPPAEGDPRWFQDGGPGAGTVVPAWFLNSTQDEIVNTIEAAGLTPDKEDDTQLAQAIPIIAAGAYVPNPYTGQESMTFPNGMIMKWGTESSGSLINITFATAFPSACINVQVTQRSATARDHNVRAYNYAATGFTMHRSENPVAWMAIGY